jgi:hypothetical protein
MDDNTFYSSIFCDDGDGRTPADAFYDTSYASYDIA